MQEDGNIMDFYVNGDVAPSGRFNYHYFTDIIDDVSIQNKGVFQVYPNPVHDKLNIVIPFDVSRNPAVTIYNLYGAEILKQELPLNGHTGCIDIKGITSEGVYVVEIMTEGKSISKKVFIK